MRRGKGDHVVVRKDGQSQVIPDRELGHGLQSVIVKWMVKVGIIATVLMVVVIYLF